MLSKSNEFVSISISEDVLKIVQVKNAKVTAVVTRDVFGMSDSDMAKTVKSALGKYKSASANAVYVVPNSVTTTKNIEIPSVNEEEIKSIVSLQAGRHTPFSRDEIQIGYINLGVCKGNCTKVLLVITNKEELKSKVSLIENSGIKLKKVLFAPEGMASFFSQVVPVSDLSLPSGIIDIGKKSTNFVIVQNGKAITTRSIPVGMDHLGDMSQKETLVDELGKTVEAYKSEDIGQAPTKYFVTLDTPQAVSVVSAVKEKLNWDVSAMSYLSSIQASASALKALDASGISCLDVIGCASFCREARVDLMPEEIKHQRTLADKGKETFKTAVLMLIVLSLVIANLGLKYFSHKKYYDKLSVDYDQTRKDVGQLEEVSRRLKIVEKYVATRMVSLDVINELYENVPEEIYLSNIHMNEDGKITIQGISSIDSLPYELRKKLREGGFFSSVQIVSTKSKKDRGKKAKAFEIVMRVKQLGDEEDLKQMIEE